MTDLKSDTPGAMGPFLKEFVKWKRVFSGLLRKGSAGRTSRLLRVGRMIQSITDRHAGGGNEEESCHPCRGGGLQHVERARDVEIVELISRLCLVRRFS